MKNNVRILSLCLGVASIAVAQTTTAPIYTMSILAGVPTPNGVGDNLPSVGAPLYGPQGVALDSSGNIFIAEYFTNRIRRIDATTGIITTFASQGSTQVTKFPSQTSSTPGTVQTINGPVGLAFDSFGNLFVSNQNNSTIVRFSKAGVPTAVMPNSNGRYCGDGLPGQAFYTCLQGPEGIAFDANNDLFIADATNGRIRMVPNTNGCLYASPIQTCTVYTIAGNQGQFTPTCSAANCPAATSLNSSGGVNTPSSSKVTTSFTATNPAGDGGLAVLAKVTNGGGPPPVGPFGIAVSPNGQYVYYSDPGINRVRVINTQTGIINTVLGACTAGTSASNNAGTGSRAPVIPCPSGTFASATSNVTTVATSTLYDGSVGSSATCNTPRGLYLDSVNNLLYVADTGNNKIRVINLTTGIVNTVVGSGTAGDSPDTTLPAAMQINTPYAVAVQNGVVYFIENPTGTNGFITVASGANRLRATSLSTLATVTMAGQLRSTGGDAPGTSAYLNTPSRLAADSSGNLYISESGTNKIRKVTTDGEIHEFAGTGAAGGPTTNAYTGAFIDSGPALAARLNNPGCMTFDGAGNMYVADTGNSSIRKIDTNGNISTVVGRKKVSTCTPAQQALGCVSDPPAITSYAGDGGLATQAILNAPQCVASDAAGDLYIADTGNNAIRYVSAASGVITTIGGGQSTAGDAAAQAAGAPGMGGPIDGRSGTAPASGSASFNANYLSDGNALLAEFNSPRGIAVDKSGNVYIAEFNNCVIRGMSPTGKGAYNLFTILGNESSCNDDGAGITTGTGLPVPPVTARIRPSTSVAVDGSGKVYVAMTSNQPNEGKLLMITADHTGYWGLAGIANTTITGLDAGLTYTSANAFQLEVPGALGVAVDSTGAVYVSDRKNLVKKLVCTKNCLP